MLNGRKILVVDDEPDILETIKELLPMCDLTTARTYEEGKRLLERGGFDIAILDIMGVDGFGLLKIAVRHNVTAVMLTANALSVKNTLKAFKRGAAYYIPKEELVRLQTYLNDVLEARRHGRHFWSRWMERFASVYDRKFGPDWQKDEREIWEKLKYWM